MISIKLKKNIRGKNKIYYSIIVVSSKLPPSSGKFIEKIGFYNPLISKWSNKSVYINFDRLSFWLNRGVKMNKSIYILIKPLLIYLKKNKNYEL